MRHAISVTMALAAVIQLSVTGAACAEDLVVEHNPSDPAHFSSIQAALDHAAAILRAPGSANNSFRVVVRGDGTPFSGPVTAISNVPIVGTETARTILTGSGSTPVITIGSDVSNVTIRNFTFQSAPLAISVNGATSIEIRNNIFRVGTGGTALQVAGSAATSIVNNTFYLNGTAISTSADILITNNIFSANSTAISRQVSLTRVSYNDFHNNTSNSVTPGPTSLPNAAAPNPDPLFVDPADNDFHLLPGSPAHAYGGGAAGNPNYPDAGNPGSFDMGAYGGPYRDTIPVAVSGLSLAATSPSSILLTWKTNKSYQVGGYRVYYGPTPGAYTGSDAAEGSSPLSVPQDTGRDSMSATLSGFAATTVPPATPVLTGIAPRDRGLALSWTPAANATGYRIYYSTSTFDTSSLADTPSVFVHGGATTAFLLSGLQNGTTYHVRVAAVNRKELFVAVTALNNAAGPSTPGTENESALSKELQAPVGEGKESALSNALSDYPEAVAPFPNLRGEGCFIATAAYGFYSSPQVQALRQLRDRYLVTNAPGRAFVAWYYRHGPRGADFLNAHPWLKAPVRLALLPLVALALFLVYTPPLLKVASAVTAVLVLELLWRRSKRKAVADCAGGMR